MLYCVSIVYDKINLEENSIDQTLVSGLVIADSKEEAMGKVVLLEEEGRLGNIGLKSVTKCNKPVDASFFENQFNIEMKEAGLKTNPF